jgi:hypothetical protein
MKKWGYRQYFGYFLIIIGILASSACSGYNDLNSNTSVTYKGGILATFQVQGEEFHVWITNADTIRELISLQADMPMKSTLYGPILKGSGENNHNAPYAWHLDPEKTQLIDHSPSSCNAKPDQVEKSLTRFLNVIQFYCPWSAILVHIDDYRIPTPSIQRGMAINGKFS